MAILLLGRECWVNNLELPGRSPLLPRLDDDVLGQGQILEAVRTARCELRDRLAD
jgi:hypothetical protein